MKKIMVLFICALSLISLPVFALAEEAESQAEDEGLKLLIELPENNAEYAYRLTDTFISSRVSFRRGEEASFLPDAPAQAMLFNWYDVPALYTVLQINAGGETVQRETIADGRLVRLIPLDPACTRISLYFDAPGSLGGVAAYAADEPLLDDAAAFGSALDKADLLIVTAEPGMEWLQFGAVLPLYAREKGMRVAVLYVSDYGKRARAYEALDGLRDAGYDSYPIFGGFTCDSYDHYATAVSGFQQQELTNYLEETIAALNPKVIVTHSPEDASGSHKLVAECLLRAAGESECVEKVYTCGTTDGIEPTVLDMNAPLNAYGGKTAAEVADSAYALHAARRVYHSVVDTSGAFSLAYTTKGQDEAKNDLFEHIPSASLIAYAPATPSPSPTPEPTAEPTPEPTATPTQAASALEMPQQTLPAEAFNLATLAAIAAGGALSVLMFLLAYRRITAKRGKGDAICLCLIPLALGFAAGAVIAGTKAEQTARAQIAAAVAAAPETSQTPIPADTPEPLPEFTPESTPEPTPTQEESYYRLPGEPAEVIAADPEAGRWSYRSDDLGIEITRLTIKDSAGKPVTYFVADIHMRDISQFRPGFGSEAHTGRGAIYPWIIARREKAVLWITGDNLINDEREEKGILIRDARLFWSANKEDTLAIYPDLTMRIVKKRTMAPLALLEDGVDNAYSFGPTLIDGGVINTQAKYHRVRRANPRAGIGYIEPGHYIAIVVDGRQKDYSVGLAVWDFADLFASYGCSIAYNLDGGLSAAMIFMGEQINSHGGTRIGDPDDISFQRAVPDGMMFGYSELVPDVDDPLINDGNRN
ncbi:MAG: phosphodiester glycosidase family protein [Eubacteriales bacterium]